MLGHGPDHIYQPSEGMGAEELQYVAGRVDCDCRVPVAGCFDNRVQRQIITPTEKTTHNFVANAVDIKYSIKNVEEFAFTLKQKWASLTNVEFFKQIL